MTNLRLYNVANAVESVKNFTDTFMCLNSLFCLAKSMIITRRCLRSLTTIAYLIIYEKLMS